MPSRPAPYLPHLLVSGSATTEFYTFPNTPRDEFAIPPRDRLEHGMRLVGQLQDARDAAAELTQEDSPEPVVRGIYLQFDSEPGFDLRLESLDARRQGIELVSVSRENDVTTATVFVPEGRIEVFFRKFEQYIEQDTDQAQPRHRRLVESISQVRLATLRALWTENDEFPATDTPLWWELWLRAGSTLDERELITQRFREAAARQDLRVSRSEIHFPENTVVLVRATPRQLSEQVFMLNCLAEVRKAKETAASLLGMPVGTQADWVHALASQVIPPPEDAPAVCLLDTGVSRAHPLLQAATHTDHLHAYDPAWGTADHNGHGTEMAGIALYGDLLDLLVTVEPIALTHRIESVKILPPVGGSDPELYGHITIESVARSEIANPLSDRVFCLTVTTTDSRDRGQPSSWSAALDSVCFGMSEDPPSPRLVMVAAGNTDRMARSDYPASNFTDGIHDPSQAWNALTIGAYTEKCSLGPDVDGWTPLARPGGLSPCSTTSLIWERQWPIKPELLLEGGNMARHRDLPDPDYHDALQLITTHFQPAFRLLTSTGDTSAATALAARMAAMIIAEYPSLWPETVRALLVHSAEWTPGLLDQRNPWRMTKRRLENMMRCFGYGVPDIESALFSARNSLTLVAQETLVPFTRDDGTIKTRDLHLHALPWPTEALYALGDTEVELRVTLSYFIEPNPGRRGHRRRFRYRSHGLRFEMKTATESVDDFRRRINRIARAEVDDYEAGTGDTNNWLFGPNLRTRGSIHHDRWRGNAVDLASKGYLAIYPVGGWWKERTHLRKWGSSARYSLIVNIRTPREDIDIYTPVANLVQV
jgi:hypothetical protein